MLLTNFLKNILLFLIVSIFISGCASSGTFKAYLKNEDKFNPGVKTYFSDKIQLTKSSMLTVTKGEFSLFHSKSGQNKSWYIETTYVSEKWLFVNTLMFNIDDKIYTFTSSQNPIRDVGYVFSDIIREVNRFNVSDDFIESLSKAETVYTRLSGSNYYHERELKPDEIKNIKWYIGYINEVTGATVSEAEKK